jgi:hypothetical protein
MFDFLYIILILIIFYYRSFTVRSLMHDGSCCSLVRTQHGGSMSRAHISGLGLFGVDDLSFFLLSI